MKTTLITADGDEAIVTKTAEGPRDAVAGKGGIAIHARKDASYPIYIAINDGAEEVEGSQWNVFSVSESKQIRKALKRAEKAAQS